MNTAPDTRPAARAPSLYEAVGALERWFGGGFVSAPARWGTADGTIEYRAVYGYSQLMRQQRAAERLHLARAQQIGHGGEAVKGIAREDEQVAYGVA